MYLLLVYFGGVVQVNTKPYSYFPPNKIIGFWDGWDISFNYLYSTALRYGCQGWVLPKIAEDFFLGEGRG